MIYFDPQQLPSTLEIQISHVWGHNKPLEQPLASCLFTWTPKGLHIQFQARFFDMPAPPAPAGTFWKLWEWEVVEFFIVGDEEHYLEIECSPHGHYLILKLHHIRNIKEKMMMIDYQSSLHKTSTFNYAPLIESTSHPHMSSTPYWYADLLLPFDLLPPPQLKPHGWDYQVNAFMYHIYKDQPYHALAYDLGEGAPDFHRIHAYPSWHMLAKSNEI